MDYLPSRDLGLRLEKWKERMDNNRAWRALDARYPYEFLANIQIQKRW